MKNRRLIATWTCSACLVSLIASSVLAQEERASAADALRSTREIDPSPATALEYYRRARSWSAQAHSDLALADFDRALALNPKFGSAFTGRANEYFRLGDYQRAIADYNEAVFLDANPGIVYCNRAGAWLKSGEVEIALDDYREAIERNPSYAPAYFGRANANVAQAKYSQALADYRQAIRIDPQFAAAYDNLAWILASAPLSDHRNGEQAVEMATKACELTNWKQAEFIATLAAAYAETGNFADAIHWQKRAIELAPERKPLQARLVTYLARRPYHAQPSKEL
jgi:tetratricopeptide (TPR) repeat protein